VFILMILMIFIGGSLALFAVRANSLVAGGLFHPISREGALVLNNLLLSTCTATVLIGTLYPLLVEAVTGEKISVVAPFFNLTFIPLALPLLVAMPFGPLLAWKRGDLTGAAQRLQVAFAIVVVVILAAYFWVDKASVAAALGLGLGFWLVFGAITDIAYKAGVGRAKLGVMFSRLKGLPLSVFGTAFAHAGIGVTVIGLVSVTTLETERIVLMQPNDVAEAGGYTLRFKDITPFRGANFTEDQANFDLTGPDGRRLGEIMAAKRLYPARGMPTTEAGIRTFGVSPL